MDCLPPSFGSHLPYLQQCCLVLYLRRMTKPAEAVTNHGAVPRARSQLEAIRPLLLSPVRTPAITSRKGGASTANRHIPIRGRTSERNASNLVCCRIIRVRDGAPRTNGPYAAPRLCDQPCPSSRMMNPRVHRRDMACSTRPASRGHVWTACLGRVPWGAKRMGRADR